MGIGEVIRPLKNSLDGVPVHVRQLADMFRKHSQRQDLNRSQVTALDNVSGAWRTDTHWTPDSIVSWKGDAPDPGEYLDGDYIRQHLARFEDGASRIYFSDTLHTYGPGQADGSTFVFPTSELDDIIRNADGDVNVIADQLGMERSWFFDDNGNTLPLEVRHFDPSELTNLRMPSGNEAGANEHWIPGGYLPTGIPEAVIDIPPSATGVGRNLDDDYNPGLWPGTAQGLSLNS
ncbi:hypothetical protein ACIGEP_00270 [Microbacterium sp. NPDC077663]|uniref:hypothetical protein n=1 Tax=Microbacterium sp. NPDC077663 TaxID=3364189 RepID=UPI0037C7F966